MSQAICNSADLDQARAAGEAKLHPKRLKILVGSASCGIAVGARDIEVAARRAVEELGLDATVVRTGCIGYCAKEPMLDLVPPDGPRVSYGNMTPEKTRELLAGYASKKNFRPDWALGHFHDEELISTGEVRTYSTQSAGLDGGAPMVRIGILQSAKKGHFAQLRLYRSNVVRGNSRLRHVQRRDASDGPHDARCRDRRGNPVGIARVAAVRRFRPARSGELPGRLRPTPSTSSATPMRASRERTWTARCWRAIRTRFSKEC